MLLILNIDLIKNIALKEPLLINKLLSPNGRVTGINIAILLPRIDEASELPEVVAFSQNLLADIKKEFPTARKLRLQIPNPGYSGPEGN